MAIQSGDTFTFNSKPLAPSEVRLRKFRGSEGISRLSHFDLILETASREFLDPDKVEELVGAQAYVALGEEEHYPIHGILKSIELCEGSTHGHVTYRVELVPRLWDLTQSFRSRVFQDMSVPEIVTSILLESGLSRDDDFVLRLAAEHPKREYTVQYQETDFAFVQRLLEYEGMFFFFEHGATEEKVVVADSNYSFGEVEGHEHVPFVPPSGARVASALGITSLSRKRSVVERKVQLVDYNYRTPNVRLGGEATVDESGHGHRLVYGEHFKTPDEGNRLAGLRAEECRVVRDVYRLVSNLPALHVGCRFTLDNHDLGAMDHGYAITEAIYAFDQFGEGSEALSKDETFGAKFTAIPIDVAFRPQRVTPWPRISGLCHGRVDGAQTTSIDDQGRYKIILPFDSAKPGTGRASRWIRMAQPISGTASRMHFPLDVGTEVLLAHIDGDPDRPIIVGAVPNPETPSPVVAKNSQQNVIATRSGIRMTFDDRPRRS